MAGDGRAGAGVRRRSFRASGRTWRRIRDPGELDAERPGPGRVQLGEAARRHGVRHPDDEHEGRGEAIRQARRDGLAQVRLDRIAYRRNTTPEENQ